VENLEIFLLTTFTNHHISVRQKEGKGKEKEKRKKKKKNTTPTSAIPAWFEGRKKRKKKEQVNHDIFNTTTRTKIR